MIFVTGGTGLIGSHLLYHLTSSNKQVVALKRKNSNLALVEKLFEAYSPDKTDLFNTISWVDGEIEDYQTLCNAVKGCDEVYHCAAIVSFNGKDTNQMLNVNVQGTANIVNACIEMGVKRLCHVSSVAAIGSPAEGNFVDENTPWGKSKGKSGYAISKFRSEMEVWRGIEMGLNAVVVNPTVVVGPGRWENGSGQIFGTIAKGFPFYTTGKTGYVDVRDVVKAMITAMQKQMWGKRFIINGENLMHKQVFETIAHEMGKKPPSINVTPWMSAIAWRLAWIGSKFSGKPAALTRDTARSGHATTYYSSKLAEKELGIKFTPIADAIANTVRIGQL